MPSRLVLGFDLLVFVFGKFPVVFCTWLCMFSATVVVPYNLFVWWAQGYSSSSHRAIHSFFYGMLFTLFQIAGLGFGPTYVAVAYALPPASRFIVILEQVSPCPVSSLSWDTLNFIFRMEGVTFKVTPLGKEFLLCIKLSQGCGCSISETWGQLHAANLIRKSRE